MVEQLGGRADSMSSSRTPTSTPGLVTGDDDDNSIRPVSTKNSTKKPTSTSSYLEQLSTVIMESITTSDIIAHHLSEDFEMVHEYDNVGGARP
jgi:hypothetical protein